MRNLLLFVVLGIMLLIVVSYSVDQMTLQHYVYHHLGDNQYYSISDVDCNGQYYVVSLSGEPHMILTVDSYDLPVVVKDKQTLQKVLVCYYNLNVQDSSAYLNSSIQNYMAFYNSTVNEYYSDNCVKFLGLHKNWCNDVESCRYVCFQKGITCQPVMLALRWDFLDAMVDYADNSLIVNSSKFEYTISDFNSAEDYKQYVDSLGLLCSVKNNYLNNPIINRWRFCGMPEYDWDKVEQAYVNGLKAYYSAYPEQSLDKLSSDIIYNTEQRVLMFRSNNYFKR